jgi:hypothetical protein
MCLTRSNGAPGTESRAHFPVEARAEAGHRRKEVIDMVNSNRNLQGHGFEQKLMQAKAGAEKYLPQNAALELSAKETTVAQVVSDFAAVLAKYQDVRDAKAAVALKLRLLNDALPGAHTEYDAFKAYLVAKLGKGNPQLTEYGFTTGVRKPTSSGTRVLAAMKAQQTRKIRHTMGRKQKLALSVSGPSVLLGPDGKPLSVDETAAVTPKAPETGGSIAGNTSGPGASPKP